MRILEKLIKILKKRMRLLKYNIFLKWGGKGRIEKQSADCDLCNRYGNLISNSSCKILFRNCSCFFFKHNYPLIEMLGLDCEAQAFKLPLAHWPACGSVLIYVSLTIPSGYVSRSLLTLQSWYAPIL